MENLNQTLQTAGGVDVLWECDASLRYVSVSPQVEVALGYGPAELVGQPLDELVPPELASDWRESLGGALERREAFEGVVSIFLHRDGRWVYLRSSAEPVLGEDGFRGFRGVHHDVTGLRQLLGELRRLGSLLESSPDFIGLADLHGKCFYLNPHGMKMVGLSSMEEVRAQSINDFMMPEAVEQHMAVIYPALLRDGVWRGQHRFRHFESGEAIPIQAYSFVVRDPEAGAPSAIAMIARDLRGEKRREAERRKGAGRPGQQGDRRAPPRRAPPRRAGA